MRFKVRFSSQDLEMFSTQLHAILCGLATFDPQSTQIELRHGRCCEWREFSNAAAHSNRAHMQTATRISRYARIPGDCPVCQYSLQGRNITKRPCQHMLCTPCYLDGVQLGLKDSSFNADACEQCRNTPCTMTRHGSTLMEHFTSSKFTKQLAVATSRKDESQGRRRASSKT